MPHDPLDGNPRVLHISSDVLSTGSAAWLGVTRGHFRVAGGKLLIGGLVIPTAEPVGFVPSDILDVQRQARGGGFDIVMFTDEPCEPDGIFDAVQ